MRKGLETRTQEKSSGMGGGGVIEVRNGALRDLHAPKNGKIEGWDSVARHPPKQVHT